MPPETCPICGMDVPRDAKACPGCGSDENTGWSDEARAADLGLPDEDFSYEEFVKREFGPPNPRPYGVAWLWWVVAAGLLACFLWFWLR